MLNNYYQKHKEKLQKKSIWKIWKSFWRRDRIWKKVQERYQNFTEENEKRCQEHKKRLPYYWINYYLTDKKWLSGVLKVLGMNPCPRIVDFLLLLYQYNPHFPLVYYLFL